MKAKNARLISENQSIIRLAIVVAFILSIPFMAMQFSSEWNWSLFDFVFVGTLLFGAGLTYDLVTKKLKNTFYKAGVGLSILTGLLLVWINAAVGIIGDDNPANLMYFGVLGVGGVLALTASFKPKGMARALFATAIAQGLVAVVALVFYSYEAPGPIGILALNGLFASLFVASGLLFKRSAK